MLSTVLHGLLTFLAAYVAVGLYIGNDMWPFITAYWLILAVKLAADSFKEE